MCGRYKLTTSVHELARSFDAVIDPALAAQRPRYNVAPTDLMPVIRVRDGTRMLQPLRWGWLALGWLALGLGAGGRWLVAAG